MPAGINTGDTAWMLFSTAGVVFMTIGVGVFYASLVQAKNALTTFMYALATMALVGVLWWLCDYSLAFGPDHGHVIGGLDWALFHNVGLAPNAALAPTIPHMLFASFQLTFAMITPALIIGAYAERMKFSAFMVFTALWLTLIYAPLAHMVWAPGGFLRTLGALDAAGGTVVHMNAGLAGLAAAIMLGQRQHIKDGEVRPPHNLLMAGVGLAMLWVGWYAFNAGSALAANGLAADAVLTTTLATCAGILGWMAMDLLRHRKPTALGAASGAVAALVAITPCCFFIGPSGSIAVGALAGLVSGGVVNYVKRHFPFDDALDTVPVHALAGALGAMLVGVFATKAINPAGANGLLAGGGLAQLGKQAAAVGFTIAFSFIGTLIVLKVTSWITRGLRVPPVHELEGQDPEGLGERSYHGLEGGLQVTGHVTGTAARNGSGAAHDPELVRD